MLYNRIASVIGDAVAEARVGDSLASYAGYVLHGLYLALKRKDRNQLHKWAKTVARYVEACRPTFDDDEQWTIGLRPLLPLPHVNQDRQVQALLDKACRLLQPSEDWPWPGATQEEIAHYIALSMEVSLDRFLPGITDGARESDKKAWSDVYTALAAVDPDAARAVRVDAEAATAIEYTADTAVTRLRFYVAQRRKRNAISGVGLVRAALRAYGVAKPEIDRLLRSIGE